MANTTCLHTVVTNTSGEDRIFGFLPPRGRMLAADAEFSEIGTVVDWMQGRGGLSPVPEKQMKALNRALVQGDIAIKQTPAVVLFDPTGVESLLLALDDSLFETATPCLLV